MHSAKVGTHAHTPCCPNVGARTIMHPAAGLILQPVTSVAPGALPHEALNGAVHPALTLHPCAHVPCSHALLVEDFSESPGEMQWKFSDIDWKFVFRSQLWGTAILTIGPVIALALVHFVRYVQYLSPEPPSLDFCPRQRSRLFCLFCSIKYPSRSF